MAWRDAWMGQQNADHHDDEPLTEERDYVLERGRIVFTTDYLRRRGSCCGSGCRNCPWDRSRRQPRRRRKVVVAIGDEPTVEERELCGLAAERQPEEPRDIGATDRLLLER